MHDMREKVAALWSEAEKYTLAEIWTTVKPEHKRAAVAQLLPGRSYQSAQNKADKLGLSRAFIEASEHETEAKRYARANAALLARLIHYHGDRPMGDR